jgi:hypothetical protein
MVSSLDSESYKVTYQLSPVLLKSVWWKRHFLTLRILISYTTLLLVALLTFIVGKNFEFVGMLILMWAILVPLGAFRRIAALMKSNPRSGEQKTLEFSATRLVFTGSDWKVDYPWTMFLTFSEDAQCFYLGSGTLFSTVIPKVSFTPDLESKFREFGNRQIPPLSKKSRL